MRDSGLAPVRAKFIAVMRRKLPQHVESHSDAELNTLCDKGIVTAARYGIATEYNAYVVVAAMLVLGRDFDAYRGADWAKNILDDMQLSEGVKAKLIELRVFTDTGTDIAPNGQ